MSGSEHPEVASIKRCEFGFTEALDDCEHCSVDEPDIGVGVPAADFHSPGVVAVDQVDDFEGAAGDVLKEPCGCVCVQSGVDPVVNLYQHGRGDKEFPCEPVHQIATRNVKVVIPVERREQGAGVDDQRHESGGTGSPASTEVSCLPEEALPTNVSGGRAEGPY